MLHCVCVCVCVCDVENNLQTVNYLEIVHVFVSCIVCASHIGLSIYLITDVEVSVKVYSSSLFVNVCMCMFVVVVVVRGRGHYVAVVFELKHNFGDSLNMSSFTLSQNRVT